MLQARSFLCLHYGFIYFIAVSHIYVYEICYHVLIERYGRIFRMRFEKFGKSYMLISFLS